MRKQASRTERTTTSSLRLLPEIGLVDAADPWLSVRRAGRVSDQLELFAAPDVPGLLAASVTIGLDVMGALVDAEVTGAAAGLKGGHDPNRAACRHGTEDGKVTPDGRRIPCADPGVRTVADDDGEAREVHVESHDTLAAVGGSASLTGSTSPVSARSAHRRWRQGPPRCGRGLHRERHRSTPPDRRSARPRPRCQRGRAPRARRRHRVIEGGERCVRRPRRSWVEAASMP